MNNFNFNLFKYFYYVAYYKGFSSASKSLNLAQSALSYNVKTLESVLGKVLINRESKTFELTEYGSNLYENLESVFEILENSIRQFTNESSYDEINIGIRHYLSDFIFKDAIEKFISKYPKIKLNIKLYSKVDTKKFEEDYDIMIDYSDYSNLIETDNKIKLCELKNIIVVGDELFSEYSNIQSISELNDADFVSMCPNKKNGKFQKYCFEKGFLVNNIVSINDSFLAKKLIKNNVGFSLVNEEYLKKEINSGEVKKLSVVDDIFSDEIIIVFKKDKKINIINKFLEILINEYTQTEVKNG